MTSNYSFDDVSVQNQRGTEDGKSKLHTSNQSNSDGAHESNELTNSDCESPRIGKLNTRLVKRSSNKFVAAIKSLQCSPRVDASDYSALEETKNKCSSSSSSNINQPSSQTNSINSRHNQYHQQQQQIGHQQKDLFANFANFESIKNELPIDDKVSILKNLELEKVLEKLDNMDPNSMPRRSVIPNFEIYSNDTEDTEDSIDNDECVRENGENKEECDDIEDLRDVSGLKLGYSAHVSGCSEANGLAVTSSSKPKLLIQNEFSQFSNDSNDTPVTCNKSVILTPNNDRLQYSRNEEQYSGDSIEFYCKPSKEILHRSLSLGDSLSPTEDDSPCRSDLRILISEASRDEALSSTNMLKRMSTIHCNDDEDNLDHDCHFQQHLEMLKFPVMNVNRGMSGSSSTEENVLCKVKQIEMQQAATSFFSYKNAYIGHTDTYSESSGVNKSPVTGKIVSNEKKTISVLRDDASAVSSIVSSFVFSSDNEHKLECKVNQAVVNSETASPAFFWKIHPHEHNQGGMQQKRNHAVVNSEPTVPAFFWKTHPRVTIKSYHFQKRKTNIS